MNFETLNGWIQFGAALATLIFAPQVLSFFSRLLKSKVRIACFDGSHAGFFEGNYWILQIKTREKNLSSHVIEIQTLTKSNRITGIFSIGRFDHRAQICKKLEDGSAVIEISNWSRLSYLMFAVRLEFKDYVEFYVDKKNVDADYDLISIRPEGGLQIERGILVAHIRLLLIIAYTTMIVAAAILRIIYLGFFGRDL